MRKILVLAALAFTATSADAGPLRNAFSRLRVRVAQVVQRPVAQSCQSCTAPAVASVPVSVAAPACTSGACQVVPSK